MIIVKAVMELTDYKVVNEVLNEGWILIDILQFKEREHAHPIYVVGLPNTCTIEFAEDKKNFSAEYLIPKNMTEEDLRNLGISEEGIEEYKRTGKISLGNSCGKIVPVKLPKKAPLQSIDENSNQGHNMTIDDFKIGILESKLKEMGISEETLYRYRLAGTPFMVCPECKGSGLIVISQQYGV